MPPINLSAEWIASGNRSHPNLKVVDDLRSSVSYNGCSADIDDLERAHLEGNEYEFEDTLFKIREREKMKHGDRSHDRLAQLDSLRWGLTYEGWEKDFMEAEMAHVNSYSLDFFRFHLNKLKRRQAIHGGDYSHDDLKFLYSLNLTYPDWQVDFDEAVENHKNGYDMCPILRWCMLEKQRMHEGDRSHPRLVALDKCAHSLTYPDWKKDVKAVEVQHVSCRQFSLIGNSVPDEFLALLEDLSIKQYEYATGEKKEKSMHPIQREILATKWDYPGWEKDLDEISIFSRYDLELFQIKQMLYKNDLQGHPILAELASMQLTYPGWEDDFEDAKCLDGILSCFWEIGFCNKIRGMKNKQELYSCSEKRNEEECCICMDELLMYGKKGIEKLRCGHLLHRKCLTQMIEHNGSVVHGKCPLCRVSPFSVLFFMDLICLFIHLYSILAHVCFEYLGSNRLLCPRDG